MKRSLLLAWCKVCIGTAVTGLVLMAFPPEPVVEVEIVQPNPSINQTIDSVVEGIVNGNS